MGAGTVLMPSCRSSPALYICLCSENLAASLRIARIWALGAQAKVEGWGFKAFAGELCVDLW